MTFDPTKYGATPVNQSSGFDPSKYGATPVGQTAAPQPHSLADSIWSSLAGSPVGQAIQQGGDAVHSAFTAPGVSPVEQGINAAGAAAGAIPNIAASALPGGKQVLGAVGGAANAAVNFAGNINDTLNAGAVKLGIMSPASRAADQASASSFANSALGQGVERGANVGQNLGNVSNAILGAQGVAGAGDLAVNTIKSTADTLKGVQYVSNALKPEPEPVETSVNEEKINDLYTRAIKPSVAGKSNAGQIAKANAQAVTGLKAIVDNKPNLSFTNADGETLTGATPRTVDQLSQSIAQTKSSLFKQYDALAQQAGDAGVTVDAPKVAQELDSVVNSKSLQLANPSAVAYAKEMQARFNEAGELDAQTAQDVIQHYNDSLKAFYRSPSYDTASKAGIDALVANKLREQLDQGISGATGEQYQQLKSQYGALSSMEKDVAHRNIVWSRQNNIGFAGNLSNIASGAELVRGLVTMNPVDLAVSGAIKAIQKYNAYINNPDVGVSRIFSELGKSGRPSTENISGQAVQNTQE